MNSITYGIGYFLAILVANVFSTDYTLLSEAKGKHYVEYNFSYETNQFLIMEITLKNISPSVTAVHLVYQDCYYGQKRVVGNIEKNTREVKFMVLKDLVCDAIVITVELLTHHGLCDTVNIAEGRSVNTLTWSSYRYYKYEDKTTRSTKYYYWSEDCLAPKPCEIVLDLENKCQDQPPSTDFSCTIEASQYINCTFSKHEQQNTLIQSFFYQTYDNNSFIGPVSEMKMRTTKISIKLELFDNNTTVNVASMGQPSYRTVIWSSDTLNLTAKDIREHHNVKELVYSATTDVLYSCQEYKYKTNKVYVGLISTDNKIKTLIETSIERKFKMAESGTILCCLCYKMIYANAQEVRISRVVENKTLLIHQSRKSTNPTESEGLTKTSPTDWLIYVVPLFLGICVVMLALYIIKQKRCFTNSRPAEETVELDNCATQNQVLYANLDLVRDENQPQWQHEEPHYANIVGVLHPIS